MAQPFSPQQRDAIREKLKESARKYAVSTGVKKTSLDMLTADAGISKSSFYKFYDSKELLFLEIAADWESQIIAAVNESLTKDAAAGLDDKRRSANSVYAAFTTIHAISCATICPNWRASFPKKTRARTIFPPHRAFSTCFGAPRSTSPSRMKPCWPPFGFCTCPSSTSIESERISSPRCTCWLSAHAKSWSRNVKGLSFSETAPLFSGIKNPYGAPSKRSLILYAPFVHGKNRVGLNEFLPSSYKLIPNASLFEGRLKSSPPMADSDDEKTPKVRAMKP